jgi:sigma-B regulation protein RsbU (phosphoserine phosphatase)
MAGCQHRGYRAEGLSLNIFSPMLASLDGPDTLQVFRDDSPYLFAGASFFAFGLLAAAFSMVRRKFEPLLVYFALFASLYGLRLWMQSDIVKMAVFHSTVFLRVTAALNALMPLPAILFLSYAGLLRRTGKSLLYAYTTITTVLAAGILWRGQSHIFDLVENTTTIVALVILIGELTLRTGQSIDPDAKTVRGGLMTFVAFALFDNLSGVFSVNTPRVEPIGFAVFLGALGLVAARQTVQRDRQLNEISKELEVAREIQSSILPKEFPSSADLQVAARYLPMTSVAGDFYDYILPDAKHAGLLIADVSGHGVPAALIASMVKVAAGSQYGSVANPSAFLAGMNAVLCGNTQGQFITAGYVYLDCEAKRFRYAGAGHPPMLLLRGKQVREVEENGLILAAFNFAAYSEVEVSLQEGDRVVLYTDGLIEAADGMGEFFGQERLSQLLVSTGSLPASEAADKIIDSVRSWSRAQEDDLTVIVCDFRG